MHFQHSNSNSRYVQIKIAVAEKSHSQKKLRLQLSGALTFHEYRHNVSMYCVYPGGLTSECISFQIIYLQRQVNVYALSYVSLDQLVASCLEAEHPSPETKMV